MTALSRRTRALRVLAVASVACGITAVPSRAQRVEPGYFAGMRWRSIGPNRSGYIAAVAGIPGDPTTYYVGTPEGGVWKTTNGGVTWKPIFDSVHVASVGAVAVAPSDPSVVYVGTGNQSGWSFTAGDGVYKSTDAGATWHNVGLRQSEYINTIVIDPRDPDHLLVAALGGSRSVAAGAAPSPSPSPDRGVYRSTDGGKSWTRVLGGDVGATELNYDYAAPQYVYATLGGGRGGPSGAAATGTGIFRSADGGVTWNAIAGQGLPAGPRAFPLAVASGTNGQRLYAEVRGGRGTAVPGGIYRSDDDGATWTPGTNEIASAGGHIYADPQHPDVLYLMGTSMYRSTDAGRHVTAYMGAPSGDDIRQLWIDPVNSRRMLIGADQGPTISVDGGASWSLWNHMQNGQFYRVSTDSGFPYHVCGPQQDSGTACVLSRSDFGMIRPNDWTPVAGFENGFIATDPLDARWVYTQGWYHVLRRYDRRTGQVVVLYTPAPDDRFGSAPPLMFAPRDPNVMYLAAQYLMTSTDRARTWRRISPDLTARPPADTAGQSVTRRGGRFIGGSIQALAPSPAAPGEIWVGTSTGLVQLTRDQGKSWVDVTPPGMPAGAINIVEASHHDPATAFVALLSRDDEPHFYRTLDFGRSWKEITTGIAAGAVGRVIREDPRDPNLLYA
ncbi:MAG: WD40/YVTN/BNR-like repeat-containing protein, partial [Gemmatimonadales bacterium]